MKLASLKNKRDGKLVVVSQDLKFMATTESIVPTLQAGLDAWEDTAAELEKLYEKLNSREILGSPFIPRLCAAPLPRAFHWADGSAYLNHMELVRKARGAELPESFLEEPLIYQGGSDILLGPHDEISVINEDWGIDLEAEIAVITGDVPMGISSEKAPKHILLVMLANDISLRNLIPNELSKGFGFYQSKPPTAFSPVAVSPHTLGKNWDGRKLKRPINASINEKLIGNPDAGTDMNFDFGELIAHAARTRPLGPGTIIGSGTVSNCERSRGSTCLAEIRTIETIHNGKPKTPFLKFGDNIRIEIFDESNQTVFGSIEQTVTKFEPNN